MAAFKESPHRKMKIFSHSFPLDMIVYRMPIYSYFSVLLGVGWAEVCVNETDL